MSIDIGVEYKGYHSDSANTYVVGETSLEIEELVNNTKKSLYEGLSVIKDGVKISDIGRKIEDFAKKKEFRECFDYCVSRAVANLATLSEYCLPFVKTEGCFISYKSEKITEEYESAKEAIKILGGKNLNQVEFYLPNSDIYRNLFVIQKIKNTPGKFPRKAGLPAKEPIT